MNKKYTKEMCKYRGGATLWLGGPGPLLPKKKKLKKIKNLIFTPIFLKNYSFGPLKLYFFILAPSKP